MSPTEPTTRRALELRRRELLRESRWLGRANVLLSMAIVAALVVLLLSRGDGIGAVP